MTRYILTIGLFTAALTVAGCSSTAKHADPAPSHNDSAASAKNDSAPSQNDPVPGQASKPQKPVWFTWGEGGIPQYQHN
jgi:hypothetical protein